MSINGISSGTLNVPQVNTANSTSQSGSVKADRDGDNDGGRVSGSSGTSARGGFASAINQALSQIGVSGSTASGASSAAQDPLQALSAFMHNLFAALQSQGGGQPAAAQGGADSDGDNDGGGASGVSAAAGGGRHHGGGNIASKLQSLIQQLSASSSGASASTTAGATASGTDTSNSALSALQQSFQNLLSSQGASGSQATLGSFLQTLAQDLPGANPAGNIVHTQA
jgi:hypothetical protein